MATKLPDDIAALLRKQMQKIERDKEAQQKPAAVPPPAPPRPDSAGLSETPPAMNAPVRITDDTTPSVTPPQLQRTAASAALPGAAGAGGAPPASPGSDAKRKRDELEAAEDGGESSEEVTRFDPPTSPIRKGAAHITAADAPPSYASRTEIPTGTSTSNVHALPHDIRACRRVEAFKRLNEIAEGTFGKVFRARDTQSNRVMALKQVKMEKEREGFPVTALREVDILMNLNHENIVCVQEIVVGSKLDSVYLVMEYVEHDVKFVMDKDGLNHRFTVAEAKNLFWQLLKGVAFMHRNWILHRDLKTSNILYTNQGVLKICDFGLARVIGAAPANITPGTCTLWSRSPEVLLDAREYGFASDMWAVGCICAEFVLGSALLQGHDEVDQLNLIFGAFGVPCEKRWPGWEDLPRLKKGPTKGLMFKGSPANRFPAFFRTTQDAEADDGAASPPALHTSSTSTKHRVRAKPYFPASGVDFMNRMLAYNPADRLTAEHALADPFFAEAPQAQANDFMPTFPATNERPRKKMKMELQRQNAQKGV